MKKCVTAERFRMKAADMRGDYDDHADLLDEAANEIDRLTFALTFVPCRHPTKCSRGDYVTCASCRARLDMVAVVNPGELEG